MIEVLLMVMGRPRFPFALRERLFDLLGAGRSLQAAAKEVGVSRSAAKLWWVESAPVSLQLVKGTRGGLAPLPAHPRSATDARSGVRAEPSEESSRTRRPLTSEDRAVIAACLEQRRQTLAAGGTAKPTLEEIGALIGRNRSIVCREAQRNSGPDGSYHGALAHRQALTQRRRPKEFRLVQNPALCRQIEAWMDDGWSPKLIATILKRDFPHMIMERVSHETIYQALYVQARGSLRKDLHQKLSTKRPRRQARPGGKRGSSRYREALKIADRPPEHEDRAVPGNWEGDLILGTGNASAIGVLVERSTRFTILLHLPGRHDAESVAEAMIREMSELPELLRQSLTWDRGVEMAQYERIQLELEMPVYFCDPRAPWQRGTNENTNRLLRHWFEKGTDLSVWSAADLRRVAASLNARPRPTLDLKTPAQALDEMLANLQAA